MVAVSARLAGQVQAVLTHVLLTAGEKAVYISVDVQIIQSAILSLEVAIVQLDTVAHTAQNLVQEVFMAKDASFSVLTVH